jgi:hypothetical protein
VGVLRFDDVGVLRFDDVGVLCFDDVGVLCFDDVGVVFLVVLRGTILIVISCFCVVGFFWVSAGVGRTTVSVKITSCIGIGVGVRGTSMPLLLI